MTLNQIATFAAIAKHLNLSRASAACHVSQSSITQQIRKLEVEYKTKLYKKSNRGIILTDRGEAFLRHAKAILADLQRLNDEFRVAPAEESKTLAVGGSSTVSAFLLQALASYRKDHPQVQLTLRTDTSLALERLVLSSELDIAVINNAPRSPELFARPYQRDKLAIFAPVNHPITRRGITMRELSEVPLIIMKVQGSKTFIERLIEGNEPGLKPNITLRCESPADVKMAVRKHMGIGVLFFRSVRTDISTGRFKLLKLRGISLNVQSYIIHRNEQSLPTHARDFIGLLYRGRENG
jgi:DNA-binding transcriptional LysR family regulator